MLLVLRSTLQVRTVPERVLEWMLLFVPLDVFEAGLRRFGFDAKRYALYGTILGALRGSWRRWGPWPCAGAGRRGPCWGWGWACGCS